MTDLESIRKRHADIIPGPWRWYGNTATDQVCLATTDRGRLYVMVPGTRTTEHVFHHGHSESYDKASVSNTQVREWCGAHDELSGDDDRACLCQDIADFLEGELPEDGYSVFDQGGVQLSRGLQVRADLRFPTVDPPSNQQRPVSREEWEQAEQRRKQHGGRMRSYRDAMPKYEVLGYRTVTEWEMNQGGVQNARDALYREDFTGLDNPEATFIEHAPEDIEFLLAEVDRLKAELDTPADPGFLFTEAKPPTSEDR